MCGDMSGKCLPVLERVSWIENICSSTLVMTEWSVNELHMMSDQKLLHCFMLVHFNHISCIYMATIYL